jgi:hypothetical protein
VSAAALKISADPDIRVARRFWASDPLVFARRDRVGVSLPRRLSHSAAGGVRRKTATNDAPLPHVRTGIVRIDEAA